MPLLWAKVQSSLGSAARSGDGAAEAAALPQALQEEMRSAWARMQGNIWDTAG
jgi:hypothetical protein